MTSVFNSSSSRHSDFKPVRDWIIEGKGKMIIGGSTYKRENIGYLSLFAELKKVNKLINVCDVRVDEETDKLNGAFNNSSYDDPHIIALIRISKCKLICSLDQRAFKYFKDKRLSGLGTTPKIYNKSRNSNLLCDKNMVDICLPCCKLSKSEMEKFK